MTSTSSIFVGYLALLTILASGVRCSVLKNLEPQEPIHQVCQNISNGTIWRGDGVESIYQPYLLYEVLDQVPSPRTAKIYNLTLFTAQSDRPCNFSLKFETSLWTLSPYQVSTNKIHVRLKIDYSGLRGPLVTVDMSTCGIKKVGEKIGDAKSDFYNNWIYHEDSFEAIHEENGTISRQSYDNEGDKVGKPRSFLLPFHLQFHSVSLSKNEPHSSNIIALYSKNDTYYVSLVDADGRLIKHLLSFDKWNERLRSNYRYELRDSVFAFCWGEDVLLHCAQFDDVGNEIYRNSTRNQIIKEDQYAEVIAVRNLKNGGVAVFSHTETGFRVVEMRRGGISEKTYTVSGKRGLLYALVVTDFDEASGRFTIRTDPKDHTESEMCSHTFHMPSHFE